MFWGGGEAGGMDITGVLPSQCPYDLCPPPVILGDVRLCPVSGRCEFEVAAEPLRTAPLRRLSPHPKP